MTLIKTTSLVTKTCAAVEEVWDRQLLVAVVSFVAVQDELLYRGRKSMVALLCPQPIPPFPNLEGVGESSFLHFSSSLLEKVVRGELDSPTGIRHIIGHHVRN